MDLRCLDMLMICMNLYMVVYDIIHHIICLKKNILYICRTKIQRKRKEMGNIQREIQTKLAKGLLDLIVMEFLDSQPMHGYQIITKIRKGFGVYFGPSTVYPLLASLEKKGHVVSSWNMDSERPRKVYELTSQGKNVLDFTENSLNLMCKKMASDSNVGVEVSVPENIKSSARFHKRTPLAHAFLKM
jgi:PadR family transcriptional regulator PadR